MIYLRKIIGIYRKIKSELNFILNSTTAECSYNFSLKGIENFTKEQKIAFNQMIDFLADMIEKYGDKIPVSDNTTVKPTDKKTA